MGQVHVVLAAFGFGQGPRRLQPGQRRQIVQQVKFSLREMEEISGRELSRNGIFKCVRCLAARGVLIWEPSGAGTAKSPFQLAEDILLQMLTDIEPSVVVLLGKVQVPVLRPRLESGEETPLLH